MVASLISLAFYLTEENANDLRQANVFTIVAAVIGTLVGLVLIGVCIFLYLYFKRRQINRELSEMKRNNPDPESAKIPHKKDDKIKDQHKEKETEAEDDQIEVPLETEPTTGNGKAINKKSSGKFAIY